MSSRRFAVVGVLLALWLAQPSTISVAQVGPTQTTCDAANPYDDLPDEAALQVCLDTYDRVLLQADGKPGYIGYIVNDTLKPRRHGFLLTSAQIPRKATIIAAHLLGALSPSAAMLRVSAYNNFEISFIRFDGNRANRAIRDKRCDAGHNFRNVELTGTAFKVRYVESFGAVCGSAMTVGDSSNFEIYASWFYDNGRQPEEANGIQGLWADGLTVFKCVDATVRDNVLWDNTDVDLGVNGGRGCSVYRNTISHAYKYAFAGLVVGDPSRSEGEFSENHVSSGYDLLGFGILVGCHPWDKCRGGYASKVNVHHNTVTGAVVNLAIDGLNGGRIENNRTSGAQGGRLLNCPGRSTDYSIGHVVDVSRLQTGYVVRTFDFGGACQ